MSARDYDNDGSDGGGSAGSGYCDNNDTVSSGCTTS